MPCFFAETVFLSEKAESAKDRNFCSLILADADKLNNSEHQKDYSADAGNDPAKERDDTADDQDRLAYRDLQRLTHMECCKG